MTEKLPEVKAKPAPQEVIDGVMAGWKKLWESLPKQDPTLPICTPNCLCGHFDRCEICCPGSGDP